MLGCTPLLLIATCVQIWWPLFDTLITLHNHCSYYFTYWLCMYENCQDALKILNYLRLHNFTSLRCFSFTLLWETQELAVLCLGLKLLTWRASRPEAERVWCADGSPMLAGFCSSSCNCELFSTLMAGFQSGWRCHLIHARCPVLQNICPQKI